MRVVLDTNVMISGLLIPSSTPGRIVQAWRDGQFEAVTSDPMLDEIERVLRYPKIQHRLGWSETDVKRYVTLLRFKMEVVEPDALGLLRDVALGEPLRDPNDLIVLQALLAGRADALVSGDEDLLTLRGQYPVESPLEFFRRF